jgi:hypothetical protein
MPSLSSGGTTNTRVTDVQAVTDGAHSVGDDGYHAADSDVGGLFLYRLSGANPLCERWLSRVFEEGESPKT